jgi:hypothetical protein
MLPDHTSTHHLIRRGARPHAAQLALVALVIYGLALCMFFRRFDRYARLSRKLVR